MLDPCPSFRLLARFAARRLKIRPIWPRLHCQKGVWETMNVRAGTSGYSYKEWKGSFYPADRQSAFEFRHQSWFDDETFAVLREHNVALCLADADDELTIPFTATAEWGYLRLRRPEYSDQDLRDWGKRVGDQPWKEAFVFFKHEEAGKGPQFATRFLELAGA